MGQGINDLVAMRDLETLYELMTESDDWMTSLDAAEGLVKLGDQRGLEYLSDATQSDDKDIRDYARETLHSPDVEYFRQKMGEEKDQLSQQRREIAKTRVQAGKKAFTYKMFFIPSADLIQEDLDGEGYPVDALEELGLEGWEVVSFIPQRRQLLAIISDEHFSGAYFLLKRELGPEDVK